MKIFQLQEISLFRTIAYNSIETISYMEKYYYCKITS